MDVIDFAQNRLASKYSVDKYMASPTRWLKLTAELPKLAAAGTHSLALAARFDVAAQQIYGDSMLSWVLLVYNGITRIGSTDGITVRKNINVSLDGYEVNNLEAKINTDTLTVMIYDTGTALYRKIPHFWVTDHIEADTDEDGTVDLRIDPTTAGIAKLTNLVVTGISFRLVTPETSYDDYMADGTDILYPAKEDIDALLTTVTSQTTIEDEKAFGFDRL